MAAGKTVLVVGILVGLGALTYNLVIPQSVPEKQEASLPHSLQTVIAPENNTRNNTREVTSAFLVGGRITNMFFAEDAEVKQGDILASLDKAPFEEALAFARIRLKVALAASAKHTSISTRDFNAIEASRAMVEAAQHSYDNAYTDLEKRRNTLVSGQLDNVYIDDIQNEHDAGLNLDRTYRELAQQRDMAVNHAERDEYSSAVRAAEADVDIAENNLNDTDLIAPTAGIVVSRASEVGDDVAASAAVYTLSVPDN